MSNPVIRGGLRLLNAFAASGLAEEYGVEDRAKELVSRATSLGIDLMGRVGRRPRDDSKPQGPKRRFDLTPTESQDLLRSTLRRFALEVLRPEAEKADVAMRPPADVLDMAADLGLTELFVPEEYGGAAEERSPVTTALIAEALGYGDMGLGAALLAPASVAHLVLDHGDEAQKEALCARLLGDGFVPAAAALLEPRIGFDPRKPKTKAKRDGGGYRLQGEKVMVPLGETAELFVVSAQLGGDARLFVVDRGLEGVEITPQPTMGLRAANLCKVELRGVRVGKDALLGAGLEAPTDHQRVVDLGRVAWGALAVGQCEAVLDYVKEYCNDRIAFGEPISHRQAVAFLVADIAIETEAMRLLVWRAAARAERGLPMTQHAHLAAVQCARYAPKIGTDGVQLLGGAGFVREHPVERWYRHLRAMGIMEGGLSA